jgi:hypothetical protein
MASIKEQRAATETCKMSEANGSEALSKTITYECTDTSKQKIFNK